LTDVLGDRSAYTPGDLVSWQPRFVEPLRYQYRDATVYLPPPPSVAGLLVMLCMRALEDHGAMPAPGSIDQVRFLAQALDRADIVRRQHLISRLFDRSFIDGFLAALVPADTSEGQAYGMPRQPGNTTHISVVDAEGNAVAITSSLGETCGLTLPGTGMLLNNFLGESDVYPTEAGITIGHRLMTMMCPTLIDLGDQVCALGSGGSSRIRSAILHGVVNLVDHAMTPAEAAAAPRLHMEGGTLYIEAADRLPGTVRAAGLSWPQLRRFEEPSMFFGGLNIAAGGEQGYTAGADPRRSGAIGIL
jgi:gamma-glutamyltranspeptidase/glutathione hydrolase